MFTLTSDGVLTINDAPVSPTYQITIASTGAFGMNNSLTLTINVTSFPFITTWRTDDDNPTIIIPTTGGGYNYTVDWGDGNTDRNQTGDAIHIYATAGEHTVRITGTFPRIYVNDNHGRSTLYAIEQWGTGVWTSMENAFLGAERMVLNATDTPNLSRVTDMSRMFEKVAKLTDVGGNMNNWDVSNVTNMKGMFNAANVFNQNIGNWEVGNVTNMTFMFSDAHAFNQNIGNWDVGNVRDMEGMFNVASAFNQNIGNWDVGNVRDMAFMFRKASAFNQNLGNWDVRNVTNMAFMFNDALAFNQNLGRWYITKATLTLDYTDMSGSEVARFTAQNAVLRGQSPAYTLGGADASAFTLTSAGVLTINDAPVNPTYQITIASTGTFGTNNSLTLTINVEGVPPPVISTSIGTLTATVGIAITPVTITSTGGMVTSYRIVPAISNGLAFSTTTGIISGTPDAEATETYAITATNTTGSATASVTIIIELPLEPIITASVGTLTATAGIAITPVTITSTGGMVASYRIVPAISNGLAFDTTTGTISGTPDAEATAVAYAITATNATGSVTASVTIIVELPLEPIITASVGTLTATVGIAITPVTITSTGGMVTSFSILPAIGNGLAFSTTTGTISGTPEAEATETYAHHRNQCYRFGYCLGYDYRRTATSTNHQCQRQYADRNSRHCHHACNYHFNWWHGHQLPHCAGD